MRTSVEIGLAVLLAETAGVRGSLIRYAVVKRESARYIFCATGTRELGSLEKKK